MPDRDTALRPTDDVSRAEGALTRMRADILSLRLAPGEVLTERHLEAVYGSSRTPIREAIMRLAMDGLICRNGRTYCVAPFDLAEIDDLFDFREVVEEASIRLAAKHATAIELDEIERTVALGYDDISPNHWLDAGIDFHLRCAELARNRCYVESLRNITTRTMRARWLALRNAEGRRQTNEEHSAIVEAVRLRDPDLAAKRVLDHIRHVREEVLAAIEAARPILGRRSIVDWSPPTET